MQRQTFVHTLCAATVILRDLASHRSFLGCARARFPRGIQKPISRLPTACRLGGTARQEDVRMLRMSLKTGWVRSTQLRCTRVWMPCVHVRAPIGSVRDHTRIRMNGTREKFGNYIKTVAAKLYHNKTTSEKRSRFVRKRNTYVGRIKL